MYLTFRSILSRILFARRAARIREARQRAPRAFVTMRGRA